MYIIGDVHGCYDTLCALIEQFPKKYNEEIVFVGDLIDKGPKSKDVLNLIIEKDYKSVLGNHEAGFLYEIKDILEAFENNTFNHHNTEWYKNWGGKKTIESYGELYTSRNKNLLKTHTQLIKSFPLYLEYKGLIKDKTIVISHSYLGAIWDKRGFVKTLNQKKRFEEYILWNRKNNIINDRIFNVYGHTPQQEISITENYANIDTGVYNNEKEGLGKLTAIHLPSMKVYQQDLLDIIR